MPLKISDEELAFNRRYWRFKVVAYFFPKEKYRQLSHFSIVKNCTVKQIRFGHVKQVVFDSEKALAECIDRIDLFNKKYGRVQRAFIYDRTKEKILQDGTVQEGKAIIKYEDSMLHQLEEIKFKPEEKAIVRTVVHRVDEHGSKTFTLHNPNPVHIDFKKEVANALKN